MNSFANYFKHAKKNGDGFRSIAVFDLPGSIAIGPQRGANAAARFVIL
jgi:hypothetical protein